MHTPCTHSIYLLSFSSSFKSNSGTYTGGGAGVGGADLGILKSLSSMSAVAKRNLNNLALQFSKHSGERGEAEERGRLVEEQGVSGCYVLCSVPCVVLCCLSCLALLYYVVLCFILLCVIGMYCNALIFYAVLTPIIKVSMLSLFCIIFLTFLSIYSPFVLFPPSLVLLLSYICIHIFIYSLVYNILIS